MSIRIMVGDCRLRLKELAAASVDAVVCDPPYELNFMSKSWDSTGVANDPAMWTKVLRVLKPGGHLVAFSGPRTQHRMVCAIEDAGFEIRDQIMWIFGSGFPKSLNIGNGLGTALKPAHEPICLARKPLESTVAANVLKHRTGALNIDGCRIEASDPPLSHGGKGNKNTYGEWPQEYQAGDGREYSVQGRWPANLCHDGSDEVLAGFPDSDGQLYTVKPTHKPKQGTVCYGDYGARPETPPRGDSGSAARFFYCAKATSEERGEGNDHPTVKPIALMRWLCRLVTPPGGTILDPFMGSGSTLIAADAEQFNAIGCELSPEYAAIAERRVRDSAGMFADVKVAA